MSMAGSGIGDNELGKENASSDDDIPDDFFDELANAQFIEDLVENAQDGGTDMFDSESNHNESRENSPRMARCLAEIDVLTKDIERRKKKLEKELSQKGFSEQELRKQLDRDIDDDDRRPHRSRRTRDRRLSRTPTRSRTRSRSPPYRHRERGHIHRRPHPRQHSKSPNHWRHNRRSKSGSPNGKRRSSSTHKHLTFLEELAKTFAEQGKPITEKDYLSNAKGGALVEQRPSIAPMMNIVDANLMLPQINMPSFQSTSMPAHLNSVAFPTVGYPSNIYYGMDGLPPGIPMLPSAHMIGNVAEVPMPGPSTSTNNVELSAAKNNQKALLEKCANAVKFIRAEENKVPKLRFLFTRTHIDVRNQQTTDTSLAGPRKSPLVRPPLNVEFKLNSLKSPHEIVTPKQQLPSHLCKAVKALGINSESLTSKMRSREIASQLSLDFMMSNDSNDSGNATFVKKVTEVAKIDMPIVEKCGSSVQTEPYHCEKCTAHANRILVNKHTQVFLSHNSECTQTDEDDYRSPLIETLARLPDAQLVAIKDFIAIMMTPRPQNTLDICNLRERMMDVYNLSQRDADAVRVAQRNRLDDPMVINQKRFRSCDSFGDSRSSRDREFEHSPHRRSNGSSTTFNQNERYIDSEERQMRLIVGERHRAIEQQERARYDDELRVRKAEEDAAHERETKRLRILEEQEYQKRLQRDEEEEERRRQQHISAQVQQQQQEQIFGFGNRLNRDDAPFQPSFRNTNRHARGAFRNDRGSSRGGRGRKF